jgi:hypothetical protein
MARATRFAGSNWGQTHHPSWSANLLALPEAEIVVDGERHHIAARLVTDEERAQLWPRFDAKYPVRVVPGEGSRPISACLPTPRTDHGRTTGAAASPCPAMLKSMPRHDTALQPWSGAGAEHEVRDPIRILTPAWVGPTSGLPARNCVRCRNSHPPPSKRSSGTQQADRVRHYEREPPAPSRVQLSAVTPDWSKRASFTTSALVSTTKRKSTVCCHPFGGAHPSVRHPR